MKERWCTAAALAALACLLLAVPGGCDGAFGSLAHGDNDQDDEEQEPYILVMEPDNGRQGMSVRITARLLALPPDVSAGFDYPNTYLYDLDFGPDIKFDMTSVTLLRPGSADGDDTEDGGGDAGFMAKIVIPPDIRTGTHYFQAVFIIPELSNLEVVGRGPFYVVRATAQ